MRLWLPARPRARRVRGRHAPAADVVADLPLDVANTSGGIRNDERQQRPKRAIGSVRSLLCRRVEWRTNGTKSHVRTAGIRHARYPGRRRRARGLPNVRSGSGGALPMFQPSGEPIPDFAHISRRFEYVEGRGTFYPEPRSIPPEIWLRCKQDRHAECRPHPANLQVLSAGPVRMRVPQVASALEVQLRCGRPPRMRYPVARPIPSLDGPRGCDAKCPEATSPP
jgi:hypothetical protein